MIPIGKRFLEIGIAFALIYTAVVWIAFAVLPTASDAQRIYGALQWWFPGVLLLIGVVSLLLQVGERRNRLILGISAIYGAILLFLSIGTGPQQFLNLFFSFIIGALLVTGVTLLLVRPTSMVCPHCGAANPEKHDFCYKCGNKLRP